MATSSSTYRYFKNFFDGIYGLYLGFKLTLKYIFKPKVTELYPENKRVLPQRFRGRLAFLFSNKTGKMLCIGCGACSKVCPPQTIFMETHKEDKKLIVDKYEINIGECISCGNCVEVCPAGALEMTKEFETASFDQDTLFYDMNKLRKWVDEPNMYVPPLPEKPKK